MAGFSVLSEVPRGEIIGEAPKLDCDYLALSRREKEGLGVPERRAWEWGERWRRPVYRRADSAEEAAASSQGRHRRWKYGGK